MVLRCCTRGGSWRCRFIIYDINLHFLVDIENKAVSVMKKKKKKKKWENREKERWKQRGGKSNSHKDRLSRAIESKGSERDT